MAGQGIIQKFRETFVHSRSALNLFPMHMARGLMKMRSILKDVDCIVEVHDARLPISGRNAKFDETLAARPRLLLLNKIDLVNSHHLENIKSFIRNNDPSIKEILYSCCKSDIDNTIRKELLPTIINTIKSSDRYHRSETLDYNVLVIGIPNVGKSTLINALRCRHLKKGGRATPVGSKPGITKSVMERIKVSEAPKVYILDTPGILPPSIPNMDVAFKLSICDTIRENVLGVTELADYLLFLLNRYQYFSYVDVYELPNPVDDVYILLSHISKKLNLILKVKSQTGANCVTRPNFTVASQKFLRDFREGKLGKIMLDEDLVKG